MKIAKKKKPSARKALTHGLYFGRVTGEDKNSKSKEPRVLVEFPVAGRTLSFEIPSEYDEETVSGHQLSALFGGSIPDEIEIDALVGKEAFFVVTMTKTAGGKPKEQIATILSEALVRNALQEKDGESSKPKR